MYDRSASPLRLRACRLGPGPPGDAPRLLLLHGNPGSLDDWKAVAPKLAEQAEVAAFDTPGFGRSASPPSDDDLDLDGLADLAISAADALGFEDRFWVIGHSHGGGVAQTLAARHPNRVAGIVMISTLGYPAHWSYRALPSPMVPELLTLAGRAFGIPELRGGMEAILAVSMKPIFAPDPLPPGAVAEQYELFAQRPEILLHMARLTRGEPCNQLRDQVARIRAPALFLHGAEEKLVPEANARWLHEALCARDVDSTFELILDGGHMIQLLRPDAIATAILRWVRLRWVSSPV